MPQGVKVKKSSLKPSKAAVQNKAKVAVSKDLSSPSSSEDESSQDGEQIDSEEEEEKEEEEEEEEEEELSELDEDDEVDVADVSSGDEDEDEEEELEAEEDDDEFPLKKKQKKNRDDGSESFANAFNSIINSKLKAYDRKEPILARNKTTLKKLESEKLELKAKKALLAEKKQFKDKHRVKQLLPVVGEGEDPSQVRSILDKEKQMKKIAQKGVVRLFNAILATQVRTNVEVSKEKVGQAKREELMNDVSKEKFLDLIAAAGED
ncbi:pre-60S ribosomal particles component [Lodderomyces elongisporus]|uniref:pre-60S ribosomal particles component n=1 Tax=Lodderomyces elongisporus TaxID=36914 RepID=UPI002923C0F1|nr:pre-60S ribosomal particles component [Lodderomyces elongisporus]WLF80546.1 pre-60S ribosomal particles component [Lodderomyces elongisporus]